MSNLKPFTWSYSALQDFENCPHAYAAKRVYKTVKDEMGPEAKWGVEVHKHLENRLVHKKPLPDMADPFTGRNVQELDKWVRAIESGAHPDDMMKGEMKMCLTRELKPTTFFAKDAWVRGVIDVTLLKDEGTTAYLYDYKSGKVKTDQTQLKLFAAMASRLYPSVQRFIIKFIWLKYDTVTPTQVEGDMIMKEWLTDIWREILPRVKRMEDAYNGEVFPMKTSGLCKAHCPVVTCPHHGSRNARS